MSIDALALVAAVLGYGVATLLLAQGAAGGFRHAVRNRAWLAGNVVQAVSFVLAFIARRHLPLLIVQPATTASLAVACALGAVLHRWRLRPQDVVGLGVVVLAMAGLAQCAVSGPVVAPGAAPLLVMLAVLVPCLVPVASSLRRQRMGPVGPGALAVGAASGVAFGISAVGARLLAGRPLAEALTWPQLLAVLLLGGGILLGQILFTTAMSGGSIAGPTSVMHIAETAGPAVIGVLILGDTVVPGRSWLALVCGAASVAGSLMLIGHGAVPVGTNAVAEVNAAQ